MPYLPYRLTLYL